MFPPGTKSSLIGIRIGGGYSNPYSGLLVTGGKSQVIEYNSLSWASVSRNVGTHATPARGSLKKCTGDLGGSMIPSSGRARDLGEKLFGTLREANSMLSAN